MRSAVLLVMSCFLMFGFSHDDVIGWRVDGSGLYLQAEPPTVWGADQHIHWRTPLPDWSNAQPILIGDKLILHAEPSTMICVDANTGERLWTADNTYQDVLPAEEIARLSKTVGPEAEALRVELAEIEAQQEALWQTYRETEDLALRGKLRGLRLKADSLRKRINAADPLNVPAAHKSNGYTSAVPISDGERVFAVYGHGVVVAYDLVGNRLWGQLLEKPSHVWGHSSTPALVGDTLIVHIKDVVGLDASSGQVRWRTPATEAWGSPVPLEIAGESYVITAKDGDLIRVRDGEKVREKIGGLTFATPLVQDGSIYRIEAQASRIKIPATVDGAFETMWETKIKGSRHYASSIVFDGLVYGVSREGWLSVLDQATGELVYEKSLGINGDNTNSVYPSLSVAGNHLYVGFEEGTVLVLKLGKTYTEVARNTLEPFRGTPLFAGQRIYLRGLSHLYCIAEQP